jgi:hypothetical protein
MSAHIERTIEPKNADKTRSHLNSELLPFPDGITNRTDAIQHRIETAGIVRKIGKNQVRAIRVMLTGTHEDMKQLESDGKLSDWCNDNLKWLKETFGADNLVSAVLHCDEKTPHIHATIVPIVTGERRKARKELENAKKKYRKKPANAARLCADDVMTREKLKHYQDSYAEAMSKYGLQRDIEGSDARHISTQQYYRDLYAKNETLREENAVLQEQRADKKKKVKKLKNQASTERLKESIGDLFTGSKTKRLEQENTELKTQIQTLETKLKQEQTDKQQLIANYEKTVKEQQGIINRIYSYFPEIKEKLGIIRLCEVLKIGADLIKTLLSKNRLAVKGALFSPEHKRTFKTDRAEFCIEENPKEQGKLRLTIDGLGVYEWFRTKQNEFLRGIGVDIGQGKGRKM